MNAQTLQAVEAVAPASVNLPTYDDVVTAAWRINGVAHRTPVLTSRTADERTGGRLFFKAENFQRGGAFKFRGAFNAVASLTGEERERGVATVSSGNHAQALALAARLHGTRAVILMPEDSPAGKLAATEGHGAEVIRFDRYTQDREQLLAELVAERGLVPIHPYDDEHVMAGQGTVALELFEQAGSLDMLLVPIGGGGLISGCATVAEANGIRVVGVEPETGDDVKRSLEAGERVRIDVPRTIADGQQLPTPGELTFEVIRERVDEVVLASDEEIVDAMRFLFERVKTVAEPSGACALAALMAGRVPGARAGVVISGGNVTAERFAGLVASGPWPGTS
jgi:threo-3-hydroxy-L-aspartate ammonia-lyase